MIISPPFLPASSADDEAFVRTAMPDAIDFAPNSGGAPLGSYPLTTALTWHNGLHLDAPPNPNAPAVQSPAALVPLRLPVRAVADGTVVFRRDPKPANASPTDPQNYNPYDSSPAWTDNGIVIVRHTTDIGATGNTSTRLSYYSVYMHLSRIEPSVAEHQPVWRKDIIGTAGCIYGRGHQIHFEICLNAVELQKLVGAARPLQWRDPVLAPAADGRTDSVFGSIYIYVPAGTPISATAPTSHLGGGTVGAALQAAQWVEIRYRSGSATVSSYRASDGADGSPVGAPIGQPHPEPDAEYNLYAEANRRHAALGAAVQATSSPSGWYELLRFGRNLGPDPLPGHAAHWRQIPTAGGIVWADLNAPGTFKFSDADFPAFLGWQCYDDDTSPDNQRCDSLELKRAVRDPRMPESIRHRAMLARRLGDAAVRRMLARAICKFPTEWDRSTIARRYEWLKTDDEYRLEPGKGWEEFEAHCKAMSFDDLPQEYKDATWHVHPRTFISHMRQCGWLSESEFVQLLPSHAVRSGSYKDAQGVKRPGVFWEEVQGPGQRDRRTRAVQDLIANHRIPLNRALRKWTINTPLRQASFFGNAVQESSWLSSFAESNGAAAAYAPWYGRGFLQLTHATNYIAYWRYRGRVVPQPLEQALQSAAAQKSNSALQDANFPALTQQMKDWRQDVEAAFGTARANTGDALIAPSDSAAFYAAMLKMNSHADKTHLLQRQVIPTIDSRGGGVGNKVYYRSSAFWAVAACVNLPSAISKTYSTALNGFDSRCSAYGVALAVLTEFCFEDAQGRQILEYPEGYVARRNV